MTVDLSNLNLANGRVHDGKLALITGGARSIGESIARNLASKGANVCLLYKTEASDATAAELAKDLSSAHGITAVPCRADVATPEGIATVLSTIRSSFPENKKGANGETQVDILVNNAAMFHTAPLEAVSIEEFHAVYHNNVLGPILLTQAVAPLLPTDRSGRIVNVSSIGSKLGLPYLTLYGGTKGALESMTRVWSRELAERATVNCVNLGSVMTDMFIQASDEVKAFQAMFNRIIPLATVRDSDTEAMKREAQKAAGRVAYPEEIAGIVAICCSPEAGWMTGSLLCWPYWDVSEDEMLQRVRGQFRDHSEPTSIPDAFVGENSTLLRSHP
ncbi:short chain dehydrogenase [Thozetella sp. PMI_491]|nr:short chain dehydrogenase [Thozetella sp. PMI_491]